MGAGAGKAASYKIPHSKTVKTHNVPKLPPLRPASTPYCLASTSAHSCRSRALDGLGKSRSKSSGILPGFLPPAFPSGRLPSTREYFLALNKSASQCFSNDPQSLCRLSATSKLIRKVCDSDCVWFRVFLDLKAEGVSRTFNSGRRRVGCSWKETFRCEAIKVTAFSREKTVSRIVLHSRTLHEIEYMLDMLFAPMPPKKNRITPGISVTSSQGAEQILTSLCSTSFRLIGHTSRLSCNTTLAQCSRNSLTCNPIRFINGIPKVLNLCLKRIAEPSQTLRSPTHSPLVEQPNSQFDWLVESFPLML